MIFNRQKIVGWILIIASAAYLAYFWRVRLMSPGPVLSAKDWFNVITAVGVLFVGIVNVRLAAARQNRQSGRSD